MTTIPKKYDLSKRWYFGGGLNYNFENFDNELSEVDWDNAISIYKQSENIWDTLYVSDNFVMDMYFDEENHRKWLTFYDRGVTILNDKNEIEYSFEIYGSSDQKVVKTLPAIQSAGVTNSQFFPLSELKYNCPPDNTNISLPFFFISHIMETLPFIVSNSHFLFHLGNF